MGSNTSLNANNDTYNIYAEQQHIEDIEYKCNELMRQNEFLKCKNKMLNEENEILKLSNCNLKRDNNELTMKLPQTNLLPKVAEKEQYFNFMKYCTEAHHEAYKRDYMNEVENSLKNIMTNSNEYIVHISSDSNKNLVITNAGKVFVQRQILNTFGCYGQTIENETVYMDFKIEEMNEYILDYIIIMNELDYKNMYFKRDNNSYIWRTESFDNNRHVKFASRKAKNLSEFSQIFNYNLSSINPNII